MAIDSVNALTTLVDAKVWLGVKPDVTTDDAVIENFIDSVSWQFNSFTHRLLKAREITEYPEGDGKNKILLAQYPVNSITSIHIDSDRVYGADTLIDSDTYTFKDVGIVTLDQNTWSKSPKANKVVYNGGYSTLPIDMVIACKDQIKFLFFRWRGNMEGRTVETNINGSVTVTEAGEMLKSSIEIMKRYRKEDNA